VHGAGQVVGQNNPGILHLQFSVQMLKNCVYALLGIVSHRFSKSYDEAVSAVSGIKCPLPVGLSRR
jgi:hypothetical protein